MIIRFMIVNQDRIDIGSHATRKEADAKIREMIEYRDDGRKYTAEERKTPETIRDIIAIRGVASNDRKLLVNGKPFVLYVDKDGTINLLEAY